MQIHELPTISGSPSGGYFATDNGTQTTKIDYTALAQAIIEQYNASTLAGSAQSVKAALDGLDGNKLDLKAGTAIANGTDVNTLQTPGTYFCASASISSSLSNIPTQTTSVGWRLDVARNGYNTDNYLTQTITGVSSGVSFEYVRGMSTKGTWGEWQKVPTRAEVDALNSNTYSLTGGTALAANTNLNTITTPGNYVSASASVSGSLVNSPVTNMGFSLKVENVNNKLAILQRITTRGATVQVYERTATLGGGTTTWDGEWKLVPTRAEIDALNSKLGSIKQVNETVVTANATITLTVANQSKACVYIIGADSNTICILIVSANAQGEVVCKKLGEATSIQTSSPNANRLDITSSSSTNPNAYIMCFYGSVTKA